MTIPKIIHLTARNKNDLPEMFRENLDIVRRLYEEYEIRIYDDEDIKNFVSTYDRRYYNEVFSRLPRQIMRVDAVRYLWMEAIGGIYFDFDIRLQQPWKPTGGAVLVTRDWTWPKAEDITVSVHNCVFASEQGHPLWRYLLNGIGKQVQQYGSAADVWPSVFDVTGPNAISRTITQENLLQRLDNIQILESSCIFQNGMSRTPLEGAIFIHQTSGSWNNSSKSVLESLRKLGSSGLERLRKKL